MTLTRAQIAFAIAALLFAVAFILDLAGVATGRVRLTVLAAFCLAIGLMIAQ
jgi:hypothetical protein